MIISHGIDSLHPACKTYFGSGIFHRKIYVGELMTITVRSSHSQGNEESEESFSRFYQPSVGRVKEATRIRSPIGKIEERAQAKPPSFPEMLDLCNHGWSEGFGGRCVYFANLLIQTDGPVVEKEYRHGHYMIFNSIRGWIVRGSVPDNPNRTHTEIVKLLVRYSIHKRATGDLHCHSSVL